MRLHPLVLVATLLQLIIIGCTTTQNNRRDMGTPEPSATPPLVAAAERGDLQGLTDLVAGGADAKGRDGAVALLVAIRELGYKELEEGHRLRGISPERRPLYVQIVKALLDAGADPNAMKFKGYFSAWVKQQQDTSGGVTMTSSFGGIGSRGEIVDAASGDLSALGLVQKEGLADIIPLLEKAGAR